MRAGPGVTHDICSCVGRFYLQLLNHTIDALRFTLGSLTPITPRLRYTM